MVVCFRSLSVSEKASVIRCEVQLKLIKWTFPVLYTLPLYFSKAPFYLWFNTIWQWTLQTVILTFLLLVYSSLNWPLNCRIRFFRDLVDELSDTSAVFLILDTSFNSCHKAYHTLLLQLRYNSSGRGKSKTPIMWYFIYLFQKRFVNLLSGL